MSNKTQLQTNNTQFSSLIEALKGKASGGSSVETCTLNIICNDGTIESGVITTVTDGSLTSEAFFNLGITGTKTVENVLCGSTLYLSLYVSSGMYGRILENVEMIAVGAGGLFAFRVSDTPNAICTITIYDND